MHYSISIVVFLPWFSTKVSGSSRETVQIVLAWGHWHGNWPIQSRGPSMSRDPMLGSFYN